MAGEECGSLYFQGAMFNREKLVLSFVAFGLLGFCAVNWAAVNVEQDLTAQSRQKLEQAGFADWAEVSFDGREASLSGLAPDRDLKQAVLQLVLSVAGVRTVHDQLKLAPAVGIDKDNADQAVGADSGAEIAALTGLDKPEAVLEDAAAVSPCRQDIEDNVAAMEIYVEMGEWQLHESNYAQLARLAGLMKTCAEVALTVIGHTDKLGGSARNQRFSWARAQAVADFFVVQGIDRSRLEAIGGGGAKPVADNETVAGRQLNRRIELRVRAHPS